jgi:hypothetical protein
VPILMYRSTLRSSSAMHLQCVTRRNGLAVILARSRAEQQGPRWLPASVHAEFPTALRQKFSCDQQTHECLVLAEVFGAAASSSGL